MMNRSKRVGALFAKAVAAGVLVATVGLAQAGFVAIGAEQILDRTTNLIWLKNWNATSPADWQTQKDWAAGLTTGDVTAGTWRLPTGNGNPLVGSANEYLQLWVGVHNSLTDLQLHFDNVQTGLYWSGSEAGVDDAWGFTAERDNLDAPFTRRLRFAVAFAVAVRSGDVVAAVPEPESLALVLVGLAAAGVASRRRPL